MSKMHIRLIAVTALLVIVLAACGGAGTPGVVGTNTGGATGGTGTQEASQTGATTAATTAATAGTTGGDAGAACVGVDTQQLMTAGEGVYTEKCAGCHGPEGAGTGDFPALAGNQNMTAANVVDLVTTYFSFEDHPKTLSPEDLSGALTFVRGSFGNTGEVVCADQITIPVP